MESNLSDPAVADLETELRQVRALRERGEPLQALEWLARLGARRPASGLIFQERGDCHRALGNSTEAVSAYQRAVELNDALPSSWRALTELCPAGGHSPTATNAELCLARLMSLPPMLAEASSLLNEGELERAEDLVRHFLQTYGAHIQGMRLLAQIGVKREVFDDAELLLEKVLELAPDYHDARYEYAAVLSHRRRYWPMLIQARHLLGLEPDNTLYRTLYAQACDGLGQYDEALKVYRQLAAENPANTELTVSIAHALKTRGSAQEAITAFRAALQAPASRAGAYHGLANMKTFRFSDEEIGKIRSLEAQESTPAADRYRLCFALGKALEDAQAFAESFRYYARGNALKRAELRFNPDIMERNMRLQAEVCTREFFAARRGFGCRRADPIFVLGLPRSGSTLIEQILASHSQVDGTLELPEIPRLVRLFRDRNGGNVTPLYPGVLAGVEAAEFEQLGLTYLEETRVFRQGAPFFVDKMPSNFRDIGFIHLILPNAKIIDARREPMACCFGNFKQLFVNGQEFTYSLDDLGRYYRGYVDLMEHWDRALPGKVLRVEHEEVVSDLEGSVRRLLEFCGLAFEPACLEFYKTARSVRTFSSEQVRQPIYREGIDQWRNFEPWLGPLKTALGSIGPA
jgi:tetratricopeptide (TPR) repeat protein